MGMQAGGERGVSAQLTMLQIPESETLKTNSNPSCQIFPLSAFCSLAADVSPELPTMEEIWMENGFSSEHKLPSR